MTPAVALLAVHGKNNHLVISIGVNAITHCQPVVQRIGANHDIGDEVHDSGMVQAAASGKTGAGAKEHKGRCQKGK